MKNAFVVVYCIVTILLCFFSDTFAQSLQTSQATSGWSTVNPFKTDVFIENQGQFNNWVKSSYPILYAVNNSDKIFFTKQGLIFKLEKRQQLAEEEKEQSERKEKKEKSKEAEIVFVNMNWEGCNTDAQLIASNQTDGYYTFGEKGFENNKAKGYKTLLYKNLYPFVDVEYTIPDKGGIKYKIILHPGADISQIKMKYSGDFDKIRKDKSGKIIILTEAGEIKDYAPISFFKTDNMQISTAFNLKAKTVSFKLSGIKSPINQTIIIDPWTTFPSSMLTNNIVMDVDHDDFGNVYISGGSTPNKLSKYSSTGAFIWTFTNPSPTWSYPGYYSEFCILPHSGSCFIGEGWTGPSDSTCRIIKISNTGTLIYTSQDFGSNNEIFKIVYNNCNKKLIAFGGGTYTSDNIKIIADTNLSGSISKNFNAFNCNNNDIVSAVLDNNGDFYALSTDFLPFCTAIEGHLQKSLFSTNYSPPCAFDVQTNYFFVEVNFIAGSIYTVRGNALALNNNYLFSYDGKILKAWNKVNGTLLSTLTVNSSYTSGNQRTHEGIDVDECNNVYVGGVNKVHVYSFNGSAFITQLPVVTNITNEVRDIKVNKKTGKLYVCGEGFVTEVMAPIYCSPTPMSVSINYSSDSCKGNACATVTGGLPPYNYQWSNGSTNNCITGVPLGTYTLTITDNACYPNILIDTIIINSYFQTIITPSNPSVCLGHSINLIASGSVPGNTYHWSNGNSGNSIMVSPVSSTTYTVIATNNSCSDTTSVFVKVKQPAYYNLSASICQGHFFSIGIHNYNTTGIYHDTLSSSNGCDSIVTTNLTVLPSQFITLNKAICQGDTIKIGIHKYYLAGTYIDTLLSHTACDSIITTHLTVNPKKQLTENQFICQGKTYHIGSHNYTLAGTYTDTLLTSAGCDSIVITNLSIKPNKQISIYPVICQGGSYNIGNHSYNASGSYTDTLFTNFGCDSIVTTHLTVNQTINTILNPVICQGDKFTVGLHIYSTPGTYNDTLISATGCDSIITTNLVVTPLPVVNLGNNIQICEGELIELKVNIGYTSYLWQDGSTNNRIIVTQPGLYWVMVNNNNCFKTDSISIDSCKKTINIWIPNAFTPNGDGLNDIFKIESIGEISKFEMFIFNRWGEQIFEIDDSSKGWDGKINGKDVPMGVYTYKIDITEKLMNISKTYSGKVTLIR